MALAHQLAIDVQGPTPRAAGERPTGGVGAGERAAQRSAVDESPECRLRRRAAGLAPAAGAAGLLAFGRLDAGEPDGGAGNAHEIAAERLRAPLQRFCAADQGQLPGDAGEIGLCPAREPGNAAGDDGNRYRDARGAARNAERGEARQPGHADAGRAGQQGQRGSEQGDADAERDQGLAVEAGAPIAADA